MSLISLIVPVYNAQAYLEKCLNSIKKQTYKLFEVILVNDGSTDGSADILNKYAVQDKRFCVIGLPHGGVSVARNQALKKAKGDYIAFMDADDEIAPDFLKKLYEAAESSQSDITWCNFASQKKRLMLNKTEDVPVLYDSPWERFITKKPDMGYCVWNKLYRSDLLKGFSFPEGIGVGEDLVFLYQVVYSAKRICHVPVDLYFYRIHSSSATHRNLCDVILDGNIKTACLLKEAFYNKKMSRMTRKKLDRQIAKRLFKFCLKKPRQSDQKYGTSFYQTYRYKLWQLWRENVYCPKHLDLKNRLKSWFCMLPFQVVSVKAFLTKQGENE